MMKRSLSRGGGKARGAAARSPKAPRLPKGFAKSYRDIVELAAVGIYRSREGRFLTANAALARILGYESAEELLGLDIAGELFFDPNERTELLARLENVFGFLRVELVLKKKDGSPVPIQLDVRVVRDAEGRTLGHEGFVHDISERRRAEEALRRSEERFRSMVENSYEVIGLLDREGRWLYASPSMLRIGGYSMEELLATKKFGERVHPEDVHAVVKKYFSLVEESEGTEAFDFRYRRKDGAWRVVEAVLVNRLDNPSVGAMVANFHDITDRRLAEEQRASILERMKRSNEELHALAARMETVREDEASRIAHELHDEIGQALTAVKIQLRTLQQRADAAAVSRELDESVALAEKALEQVRDLSLALRPSVLDDLGLAAALRWYLDRQAQLAGFAAEFSSDLPPARLPRALETACFRVGQQALTNVVRHSRARRVSVELRRENSDLWLSVRDDGVGFDVAAARRRAVSGESLGLLGMEERVSQLGGAFEVRSVPSGGTEVRVRFPVAAAAPPNGDP